MCCPICTQCGPPYWLYSLAADDDDLAIQIENSESSVTILTAQVFVVSDRGGGGDGVALRSEECLAQPG